MARLDFIERRKISKLLNRGGYVLDFTNTTWRQFVIEKTGADLYSRYGMSKGKNLEAILENEDGITAGNFLIALLDYMQYINEITDDNKNLFNECVRFGNRLLGKKSNPTAQAQPTVPVVKTVFDFQGHLQELKALSRTEDSPQSRGHAFEKYLNALFAASGLDPRGAFKIQGEQIDGSFVLRENIYLLEAKWQTAKSDKNDLVVFNNKVSSKSGFTRGLFISYSGYSEQALSTLAHGITVNTILMTVQELVITLERNIPLPDVLWNKVRALAETGNFNKLVFEI